MTRRRRPRCSVVNVDGVPVLARFDGDPSRADLDALAEVIRAATRRLEQETSMTPTNCRSCNAQIWWALTEAGKNIPLDRPSDDGNLAVHRDADGQLRARTLVLDEQPLEHERRATSHFATCPNADAHRRPR